MPSPLEFSLSYNRNTVVTTLVRDVKISPGVWHIGVKQAGKATFYGAARVEYTENSATFGFDGTPLMDRAPYYYVHHEQTFVTEVFALIGNVRMVLFSQEV